MLGQATEIAAASQTACALLADRSVECWGDSAKGQLGDGSLTMRPTPGPVQISNVVAMSARTSEHFGDGAIQNSALPRRVSGIPLP